jgi:hypothetical protein
VVSEGQQNTPAAHRSGRSRVQLKNLANIAAYVVARIVPVLLSGRASGEFQTKGTIRSMDNKPDPIAEAVTRNPRKNFFLSVNYLTFLGGFLNDAA